jgi:L-asparaginase / beta-aspartyl-peptidase
VTAGASPLRVVVDGGVDSPGGTEVLGALERAARTGERVLAERGDAVAAVEATVRVLEADPLFNAGLGSVLNEDGAVETDAGIADGARGRFAGVAALSGVLHPVSVAAELLHRSPGPVLPMGAGAARFARHVGAPAGEPRTAEQIRIWEQARTQGLEARSVFTGRRLAAADTVGAIALDGGGRLAASSTGGALLKMPGRVGDAAIFGAGIYADASRATLCSGLGEAAIELSLALRTASRHREEGDAEEAVRWGAGLLSRRRAVGGVVLFDAERDRIAVAHNAADFPVVAHDGECIQLVDPVRLPGAWDG